MKLSIELMKALYEESINSPIEKLENNIDTIGVNLMMVEMMGVLVPGSLQIGDKNYEFDNTRDVLHYSLKLLTNIVLMKEAIAAGTWIPAPETGINPLLLQQAQMEVDEDEDYEDMEAYYEEFQGKLENVLDDRYLCESVPVDEWRIGVNSLAEFGKYHLSLVGQKLSRIANEMIKG